MPRIDGPEFITELITDEWKKTIKFLVVYGLLFLALLGTSIIIKDYILGILSLVVLIWIILAYPLKSNH